MWKTCGILVPCIPCGRTGREDAGVPDKIFATLDCKGPEQVSGFALRGPLERTVSFGRELQTERQRREISLESIAEGTKVPTRHLRALEQEQFEQLPGGVFNKGILRSYCRHLGLNEQEWLERFPAASPANTPDWVAFAENVRRNRESRSSRLRGRWLGLLLMLLALGALAWGAWKYVLLPRLANSPESSQSLSQPAARAADLPGESNWERSAV